MVFVVVVCVVCVHMDEEERQHRRAPTERKSAEKEKRVRQEWGIHYTCFFR